MSELSNLAKSFQADIWQMFDTKKKTSAPQKEQKTSLQKKGQKDTVDGRNPANHLGCTKPCK